VITPILQSDPSYYNPRIYDQGKVDLISESGTVECVCMFRMKDAVKYKDDACTDLAWGILCTDASAFSWILVSGKVVKVRFGGEYNPMIDPVWLENEIIKTGNGTIFRETKEST
jgi:hypothetical protein